MGTVQARVAGVTGLLVAAMMLLPGGASAAASLQGSGLDFGQGGSGIYDNGDLHVKTDDTMYLDAKTVSVKERLDVSKDLYAWYPIYAKGNLINFGGGTGATPKLDFNKGGSSIYDNGNLTLKTDDNLVIDATTLAVNKDLNVARNALLQGDVYFNETAGTNAKPDFRVDGYTRFDGTVDMGAAYVAPFTANGLTVTNDATINSGARIGTGSTAGSFTALADDSLFVEGMLEVDGAAQFDGAITAASTLAVTGASTLTGNVTAAGDLTVTGTFSPAITSATSMAVGGGYGDTGATIAATGNISTNGTLIVDGASTLTGATTVTGVLNANGGLDRSTAAALAVGAANATAVNITPATNVTGLLTTNGGISIGANALTGTTGIIDYTNLDVDANGNMTNVSAITSDGAISTTSTLNADGVVTLAAAGVATTVEGTFNVDQAATFDTTLGVTGLSTLNGLAIDAAFAVADTTGNITGTGTYAVTGVHDIAATGVVTTVKGTFNVDEAATFDTTLGVTGAVTTAGDVTIGNAQADTMTVNAEAAFQNTANISFESETVTTGDNATATITPASSYVNLQCNRSAAQDTAITMSETGARDGQMLYIVVDDSTNDGTCSFADSAGVLAVSGTPTLDDLDSLTLIYKGGATAQWVQLGTSNN